jgi:hypothetical protein
VQVAPDRLGLQHLDARLERADTIGQFARRDVRNRLASGVSFSIRSGPFLGSNLKKTSRHSASARRNEQNRPYRNNTLPSALAKRRYRQNAEPAAGGGKSQPARR